MKKNFLFLTVLTFAISGMTACGSQATESHQTSNAPVSSAEEIVETDAPMEEDTPKEETPAEEAPQNGDAPVAVEAPEENGAGQSPVIPFSNYEVVTSTDNISSSADNSQSIETDWKTAYIDYINANPHDNMTVLGYCLIDIDGDAIPELYIDYNTAPSSNTILTIYDGKLITLSGTQWFRYIKGENVYCYSYEYDAGTDTVYKIENGVQKIIAEGTFGYDYASNSISCVWNGETVSEDEYQRRFHAVFDEERASNPYQDEVNYTYPNIIEAIEQYGGTSSSAKEATEFLGEEQLKNMAEVHGTVAVWEYADYDGNGEKEAFAIISSNTDGLESTLDSVYFISSIGEVTKMSYSFEKNGPWSYYQSNDGYYRECQGKGFFWCDYGAWGSGYHTLLFSVKDGIPYELDIAQQLQGFYQSGERFYTTKNDISNGHSYPEVDLIYDANSQQFRMG